MKMPHRFTLIIIIALLLGAGFYLAPGAPSTRAAAGDWLLAWSSNSYVPQNYEGKALPSRGSAIKVSAIPTKKLPQNPDALYYRWLLDGDIMGWAQGRGKSSFEFKVTKWGGDSHEIESQILDSEENVLWRGSLSVKIVNPQVLFKTIGNNYSVKDSLAAGTGQNLTFIAEPLFFNAQKISDLIFNWTLDGQALTSPDGKNPDQLTIKIPSGNLSTSIFKNLSLSVQNVADQLQQSKANLSIEIK